MGLPNQTNHSSQSIQPTTISAPQQIFKTSKSNLRRTVTNTQGFRDKRLMSSENLSKLDLTLSTAGNVSVFILIEEQ